MNTKIIVAWLALVIAPAGCATARIASVRFAEDDLPQWKNHRAYLQRIIATVETQWLRILTEQKANPSRGNRVAVKFFMDDEGKIARIINVDSNANNTTSRACVSAITDRSPYGPWTEAMKHDLGDRQELVFVFSVQ